MLEQIVQAPERRDRMQALGEPRARGGMNYLGVPFGCSLTLLKSRKVPRKDKPLVSFLVYHLHLHDM